MAPSIKVKDVISRIKCKGLYFVKNSCWKLVEYKAHLSEKDGTIIWRVDHVICKPLKERVEKGLVSFDFLCSMHNKPVAKAFARRVLSDRYIYRIQKKGWKFIA